MRNVSIGAFFQILLIFVGLCGATGSQTELELESHETRPNDNTEIVHTGAEKPVETFRRSRYYRRGYNGRKDSDHDYQEDEFQEPHYHDHPKEHEEMKSVSQPKVDYWAGYYDFLINEGSYKFWAVFQLATAALLIYSGFAALYYAKVNPATDDDEFDDIFRRRKRRAISPWSKDKPFGGLDPATFQMILDAISTPRR